jgi:hypothetical protein
MRQSARPSLAASPPRSKRELRLAVTWPSLGCIISLGWPCAKAGSRHPQISAHNTGRHATEYTLPYQHRGRPRPRTDGRIHEKLRPAPDGGDRGRAGAHEERKARACGRGPWTGSRQAAADDGGGRPTPATGAQFASAPAGAALHSICRGRGKVACATGDRAGAPQDELLLLLGLGSVLSRTAPQVRTQLGGAARRPS